MPLPLSQKHRGPKKGRLAAGHLPRWLEPEVLQLPQRLRRRLDIPQCSKQIVPVRYIHIKRSFVAAAYGYGRSKHHTESLCPQKFPNAHSNHL